MTTRSATKHTARFARTYLLATLDEETQGRSPKAAGRAQMPSWATLDRALADIKKRMEEDIARGDEPIFHLAYSGHGARDERGQYALTLNGGGVTQQQLYERVVGAVPAKYHHLIIDACHAEAIVGSRGMFDKEKNARVKVNDDLGGGPTYRDRFPTVGTIVGTTIDQQTHEWSKIQSGVFTHAVLSALHGAADINTDGIIEYSEVQAFVAAATRTFSDPRNKPRVAALPPKLNVHAELIQRSKAEGFLLTGLAGKLGHFFIELENGERYLDANVTDDAQLSLLLPRGIRAWLGVMRNSFCFSRVKQRPDESRALVDEHNEKLVKGDLVFSPWFDAHGGGGTFALTF